MMQWMVKYTLYVLIFCFPGIFYPVFANTINDKLSPTQQRLDEFSSFLGISKFLSSEITQSNLPPPYDFLLVQPLMTLGIEQFYQRTLRIQVIHEEINQNDRTYSQAIQILLERDKDKNYEISKPKQEGKMVAGIAYIKINFNELPQEIIKRIIHTQTPLGKILASHKINTSSQEEGYFSISCNVDLVRLLQCKKDSTVYGRLNTLIRTDNKKWIAQVLEILPGLTCKDKQCTSILEDLGKNAQ